MELYLGEKIKALRKARNVSQEKLAKYLNVSFQAVSKWENSGTYPDISLLPEIARFFGITVDELLQAEKFEEEKLFREYEEKAAQLIKCKDIPGGTAYVQAVNKIIVQIRDIIYPDDDMGFEDLRQMCILHRCIAEEETSLDRDENLIKYHLTRALECARKSLQITEHDLTHPLLMGWKVYESPSDNKQVIRMLKDEIKRSCFDPWRDTEWFAALEKEAEELSV